MIDDEDEDEFGEAPPSLREILAQLFYKLMQRLRGLILRWRFLSLTGKVMTCFCLCVVMPSIFFGVLLTVIRIVNSPPPSIPAIPADPNAPPPPTYVPQASGIWGVPKKGSNVTEQPFRTRPPGPPAPVGPKQPGFIPPRQKDWLHVVMATMNRGMNGSGSTVLRSLQSIFKLQNKEEIYEQNITISILNGNGELDKHPQLYDVMREFEPEFASGRMEIIHSPAYEKLNRDTIKRTWNDSLERKENLDFCFAVRHASQFKRYILFLEDDIKATNVWATKLLTFFHNCDRINATTQPWMFIVLYFPHGGTDCVPFGWNCCTQAFVMKWQDVGELCEFIERQFDENPIDWLLAWWRRKKRRSTLQVIPNLFQHWSTVSTLSEKANGTLHESLTFEEW